MNYRSIFLLLILTGSALFPLYAKQPATVTDTTIESGFSPDGSAELLVLGAINNAKKSINVAAYSFTSPVIANALVQAKKRGVNIAMIVDYKQNNLTESHSRGKAALNLLVNAKIAVRTLNTNNTQHSKYMVIDNLHVQTGSYNYSASAARYNHENVVLIRHNRQLAKQYLANWRALYNAGVEYKSSY